MEQNYFLGLDMGTGSLGWAVTNDKYEVLRKHGKALWGVRLFESANTAEERRGFRTARRRLDRRNWRLQILQELFAEEIAKVDPGFYLRMKESKYYPEDKRGLSGECPELPYALFVDKNFTDKDYHQQFPTIYHLRKMLMTTNQVPDIRLVYLAFHHMMKHRGHFLLHGNINEIKEFNTTFSQFIQNIKNEELEFNLSIGDEECLEIEAILRDQNITKSAKKSKLWKLLGAKTACEKGILNLIVGGKAKLSDIFNNKDLEDSERPSISFDDNGYEDYIGVIEDELGEQYYIIESAKAVYDWVVLADILKDSQSISDAKVKIYEKHKKDLAYLKTLVKKHMTKAEYEQIFVKTEEKLCNYCGYIGMTKKNGRKIDLKSKRCNKEEFYDFLKKTVLKKLENVEDCIYLKEELEKGTFLPKQVNKDNGVIPYQIHQYELEKIIDNLADKIPLLKEKGDKIKQLFAFKIPYYVGPLNGEKFSWAVRKNDNKIYPWNFNEVIDLEESAEMFIRRMTNKCTYLYGEDVLPKDSLLYSKFMVLNELNNLRLNGEKISTELKQRIYEEVFCRTRKVTQKKLKKYLCIEGIADKEVEISGIDGEFKASLTAHHDFKEKLTGVELSQKDKEGIILDIVLFGDDKKLLTGTYFMLVKSKDKKGKEMRSIEFVPLYLKDVIEQNEEVALEYLRKERNLREPEILVKKIKTDTLFKVDGFKMWLSGRTGNQLIFKGANQLILSEGDSRILKKVVKFNLRRKENKNVTITEKDEINTEILLQLYDTFLWKIQNTIYGIRLSAQEKTLKEKRETFSNLSLEEQTLVLYEILHMFQCQSVSANLKAIGGPGSAGILVMNNNITKCNQISIINQSPTGVYEQEIDLLKV